MAENVILKTQILLRNDTAANWTAANPVLGQGEVGLETDTKKLKVGDGTTAWNSLGYYNEAAEADLSSVTNKHYEVSSKEALDAIATEDLVKGDIGVVRTVIAHDPQDENPIFSYTAYVWNGTAWAAMDGNYNAEDIYIDSEITLAGDYTQIGNYKKGEKISAGTSLSSILSKIFTKTLYPSKPTPSVSISLTGAGSYEVGSTANPSFTVTFDPKTYAYGSEEDTTDGSTTGSAPDGNATITIVGGSSGTLTATMSGNTGTVADAALTVDDNTNYYGSAVSLKYTDGYNPLNNLDQNAAMDPEGATQLNAAKVVAGTATNNTVTSKITSFRYSFRYSGTDNTSTINDAWIHNTVRLNTNNMVKNAAIGSIAVAEGDKRVMFAVPGTSKTLKEVKDVDGMGLDIKDKFTKTTMQISGKNVNEDLTTYTVWYFENPNGFSKTTMTVTFN